MPYVIQTRDRPDRARVRAERRAELPECPGAHRHTPLVAGALIDDGQLE